MSGCPKISDAFLTFPFDLRSVQFFYLLNDGAATLQLSLRSRHPQLGTLLCDVALIYGIKLRRHYYCLGFTQKAFVSLSHIALCRAACCSLTFCAPIWEHFPLLEEMCFRVSCGASPQDVSAQVCSFVFPENFHVAFIPEGPWGRYRVLVG